MTIQEIIKEIYSVEKLTMSNSFEIARECSLALRQQEQSSDGRKILVSILDNWEKLPIETIEIWSDLIETSGFYPYLEKERDRLVFNDIAGQIRKELHSSKYLKNIYFHEEQKILKDILESGKNLIISAPTSFGKSLLIEEIVASKKYKNIIIIQPTLALIDETRRKVSKYRQSYKVIVRTSQQPSTDKGNIFLFTAERVAEYKDFPKIDFLVIDEFYKLSSKRDDERSDILNNAFHRIITIYNPSFYLSGPNIDGISNGFAEKYNAVFYKTDYSLIGTNVFDIYSEYKSKFSKSQEDKSFKKKILFDLLASFKEQQSIVYCSSPEKARSLAAEFQNYLLEKNINSNVSLPLIDWIKENIDEKWSYISCLEYGIAVHDGALQRHMTSSVIDYFNNGLIKYLFCTSTIIEGVNTSAKNIIIFDGKKGSKSIDYFDYSNIKGRSGRMMIHYIGNVYSFIEEPKKENIIIDIPFFDQQQLTDEVLITLGDDEVKNKETEQYKNIKDIPDEIKEIVKKNGVNVKGQLKIVEEIENLNKKIFVNKTEYSIEYLLKWQSPTYDQLCFVFSLCWRYLKNPKESLSVYSAQQLAQRVMTYKKTKNIKTLLIETNNKNIEARSLQTQDWHKKFHKMSDSEIFDESVRNVFQLYRHWFGYKVPKWISVVNQLQSYIFEKNGKTPSDYSYFANSIENDFIQDNLRILLEYNVPKSAIDKLNLNKDLLEDEVLNLISKFVFTKDNNLSRYEMDRLMDAVGLDQNAVATQDKEIQSEI